MSFWMDGIQMDSDQPLNQHVSLVTSYQMGTDKFSCGL